MLVNIYRRAERLIICSITYPKITDGSLILGESMWLATRYDKLKRNCRNIVAVAYGFYGCRCNETSTDPRILCFRPGGEQVEAVHA